MIPTRVFRRTLVAGVLGFLVCSFLYGTSIENRLTDITSSSIITMSDTSSKGDNNGTSPNNGTNATYLPGDKKPLQTVTTVLAVTQEAPAQVSSSVELSNHAESKTNNTHISNNTNTQTKKKEDTNTNMDTNPQTVFKPSEICSYFHTTASSSFTASSIWNVNLSKIYNSSHHPGMQDLFPTHNATEPEARTMHELLFDILTPNRFRKGMLHIPPTRDATHEIITHILQIAQKRMKDSANNPPVKIAVVGGSVTQGRACFHVLQRASQCAWPYRFELLINQFVGMEVIKVYNLALGGTTTGSAGSSVVEYWMYRESDLMEAGPDIIVNSYSTNDSHGHIDQIHDDLQDFIRKALVSKPCGIPPLIVHVDDYSGGLQSTIRDELNWRNSIFQLAKWYDTAAISYADVVRDLVYQDTTDKRFFHDGTIHFGHWPHQIIAWTVGFGSLNLLTNYCGDEYARRMKNMDKHQHDDSKNDDSIPAGGVDADNNSSVRQNFSNHNHDDNLVLLVPPLTNNLLLKNVTAEFTAAKTTNISSACDSSSDGGDHNPCAFAWITTTPDGFGHRQLNSFMHKYGGDLSKQWQAGGSWIEKIGWEPNVANATFTLSFESFDKEVTSATVFYMQSYGEKWADSKARFTVSADIGDQNNTATTAIYTTDKDDEGFSILSHKDLLGVHNETTSITASAKIKFSKPVPVGKRMKMKVDLISGSTFKIIGLMFCRR